MAKTIAVGQSGGATAVINDTLAGVIYESQLRKINVRGLQNGLEGGGLHPEVSRNFIDLTNVPSFLIRGTPGPALGATRMKFNPEKDRDEIEKVKRNMKERNVECIFLIGGNDSALTVKGYSELGGRGIHIAKTEDNDLPGNDHTPGWGSANLTNSEIIRALEQDIRGYAPRIMSDWKEVYSTAPVTVVQTQGRGTGWIALGTAFAKINHAGDIDENAAPHLFLIRERAFDENELLGGVDKEILKRGYCFIVCNEELVNKEGETLAEVEGIKEREDGFNNVEHSRSGAFNYAEFIARKIKEKLRVVVGYKKIKETPITPHHIQRSLMRSLIDAQEAFELGREAVRAFDEGQTNISIALQRREEGYDIFPVRIPLEVVAGKVRLVDKEYIKGIEGPSDKFYKDFLPLVGGALAMSHYTTLERLIR